MTEWDDVALYLVAHMIAVLYALTEPRWAVWTFQQIARPIRWIERKVRR